jgi:ABC-type Zn uptake system ZnuABC Zn-binding protein ZnuA
VGGLFLSACAGSTQPPVGAPRQAEAQERGGAGAQEAHPDAHADDWPELSPVSLGEGEKLRVVATTNIVADVVSNVGSDKIALIGLMPVGADPHTYEPTPQDLRSVADAHVIFVNGLGLEEFLAELIENAGRDAPIVSVSSGIEVPELEGKHEHAGEEHEGQGEEGGHPPHAGSDPHAWLDPNNVILWTENIEHALGGLDPDDAEVYKANADAYIAQLKELDTWVQEQVTRVPETHRKLVTDHAVFGYFAGRYGFELVGAIVGSFSTVAEPSAQELAELEDAIQTYGVPAVFVGTTVNPKLSEQIARDTGIKLVPVYTGSLGNPDSGAGTYIDYMRYNVNAIVSALK